MKYKLIEKFCVRTKWMIPYSKKLFHNLSLWKFYDLNLYHGSIIMQQGVYSTLRIVMVNAIAIYLIEKNYK